MQNGNIEDDSVSVMEISVEGPQGPVIEPEEFVLDRDPEVLIVGDSVKSNLYIPEVKPPVKLRLLPRGRLQRRKGWRWREVLPGDMVSLGEGHTLGWSFALRSRDATPDGGARS